MQETSAAIVEPVRFKWFGRDVKTRLVFNGDISGGQIKTVGEQQVFLGADLVAHKAVAISLPNRTLLG